MSEQVGKLILDVIIIDSSDDEVDSTVVEANVVSGVRQVRGSKEDPIVIESSDDEIESTAIEANRASESAVAKVHDDRERMRAILWDQVSFALYKVHEVRMGIYIL